MVLNLRYETTYTAIQRIFECAFLQTASVRSFNTGRKEALHGTDKSADPLAAVGFPFAVQQVRGSVLQLLQRFFHKVGDSAEYARTAGEGCATRW